MQSSTVRSPHKRSHAGLNARRKRVDFDFAGLPGPVQLQLQEKSAAIYERLGSRLVMRTGEDVVHVGLRLHVVQDSLGPKDFQAWVAAEFRWKQPYASKLMCAARVFQDVDCLDGFQPSALYSLAGKRVPATAREEAIAAARAGGFIKRKDADAIIDRHTGGWAASNAFRKSCHATERDLKHIESRPNARDLAAARRTARSLGTFVQRWSVEKVDSAKASANSCVERSSGTKGAIMPQEYFPARLAKEKL